MSEKGISFRRIHGRIVPINMSHEDKVKVGGAVGAGVAAGALFGSRKATTAIKSAQALVAAKKSTIVSKFLTKHVGAIAGVEDLAKAAKFKVRSSQYALKSAKAATHGKLISGGLFAYAANKVLNKTKLKNDEPTKLAIETGSAIAGAKVVEVAAHARLFGIKSAVKTLGKEAKVIAKVAAKFAIKSKLRI